MHITPMNKVKYFKMVFWNNDHLRIVACCFCALNYCDKFDVGSTILNFDAHSVIVINRPTYQI